MTTRSFETHSPRQTIDIGRWLGERMPKGSVVTLHGELGAGKTQFCKGLVAGATGLHPDLITSPTFALHNIHQAKAAPHAIHHLDVYRLQNAKELADLGWDDLVRSGETILIEWAERVSELIPDNHVKIILSHTAHPQKRLLGLTIPDQPAFQSLNQQLAQFDLPNHL